MKLLLPLLLILLAATVSAQERFTKRVVSESSAWAAWETKNFWQLKEADQSNGPWVKLVLPTETVARLRQGLLSEADYNAITNSLVIALGIVIPVRTCTDEEAKGETDRVIRTENGICRRL